MLHFACTMMFEKGDFMNKLKRLRGESGLSLRELAQVSGVDQKTISFIENDKSKAQLTTLAKLAKPLKVELDDLLEFLDTKAAERGKKGGLANQAARRAKEQQAENIQKDDPSSYLTTTGAA